MNPELPVAFRSMILDAVWKPNVLVFSGSREMESSLELMSVEAPALARLSPLDAF